VREIDGIKFVYVPAGEFTMGSDDGDSDEKPVHTVYLDSYWVMRTEVTNAQYRRFVDANGYTTERFWTAEGWKWRSNNNIALPSLWADSDFNGAEYPAVGVSWYEAVAYAKWLSERLDLTVRLPTEAEWEKGARGTDGRTYPWGDGFSVADANIVGEEDGYLFNAPVGNYVSGASPYGALDMAGNVWEWVSDWYAISYMGAKYNNPSGPVNGIWHVLRGGSRYLNYTYMRTTYRIRHTPDYRHDGAGFRLVVQVN